MAESCAVDTADADALYVLTGLRAISRVTLTYGAYDALNEIQFHPNGRCWAFSPCDDAYHFGIRGDHYVVVDGFAEGDIHTKTILVVGNHKGQTALAFVSVNAKPDAAAAD